jgi:ankyrin repeat protein
MPTTIATRAFGAAYLALHQAADRDDVAILKDEILKGGNIESLTPGYQETPLHRAAFAGAVRCVSELLRAKADPNAKRAGGFTPLHLAQSVAVVRLLLDHGADREIHANVRPGSGCVHHVPVFGTNCLIESHTC